MQTLNLEDKAAQINRLCVELVKSIGICEGFNELLSELFGYLQFTNTPEFVFETELTKARKAIHFLLGQTENIQAKLENAVLLTVDIGLHFEWLRAVNKNLLVIETRLENEMAIFRHQRIIL